MIEGVVKFELQHQREGLPPQKYASAAAQLSAWRDIFVRLGVMGQADDRYGGAGFGNLSVRVAGRAFLISGTQTGALPTTELDDYALVTHYSAAKNLVESVGMVAPSSESMTHGAIYDLDPTIGAIVHVHSPQLFASDLPRSRDVAYGTPAMAREVERLYDEYSPSGRMVFIMAGHEDGVISFAHDLDTAGRKLLRAYASAREAHGTLIGC